MGASRHCEPPVRGAFLALLSRARLHEGRRGIGRKKKALMKKREGSTVWDRTTETECLPKPARGKRRLGLRPWSAVRAC